MLLCGYCAGGNRQGFRIISDTGSRIPLDTIISDLIGERIDNDADGGITLYVKNAARYW